MIWIRGWKLAEYNILGFGTPSFMASQEVPCLKAGFLFCLRKII